MSRKLVPRRAILALLAGALVLPITIGVILAVAALLVAMDDTTGGKVLRYIALGCGILWVVDLIALLIVQGLNALTDTDERPDS